MTQKEIIAVQMAEHVSLTCCAFFLEIKQTNFTGTFAESFPIGQVGGHALTH